MGIEFLILTVKPIQIQLDFIFLAYFDRHFMAILCQLLTSMAQR